MTIINDLRSAICTNFKGAYALNDLAHQETHFEEVFQCGKHINKTLGFNFRERDILFAAYFHDMFAWSRNNHHILSKVWFQTTDHPLVVDTYKDKDHFRTQVAFACGEHRASFKGSFTYAFSELINSADRCFPGDIPAMVERSRLYWLTHKPNLSDDERMAGVIAHLKEKFGRNGYARYPDLYIQVFGDKLKEQQTEIDQL